MKRTLLYQISEKKSMMMSFVILTRENNCIVIDGGRKEDMPLLKKYTANRQISAWILTHPHDDHIGGFISEIRENNGKDFNINKIYYNFPPPDVLENSGYKDENSQTKDVLNDFLSILPYISDKLQVVNRGDKIHIDECEIEFLYTYHKCLKNNAINDSSLVFKITTPKKTSIFLGDLGPEGGEFLFRESRDKLKSDIVQMANHGHMNVGLEVYAEISPEICLWCCPSKFYEECEIPEYLADNEKLYNEGKIRMYGTAITRNWMDMLGAKKHFISSEGTYCIEI